MRYELTRLSKEDQRRTLERAAQWLCVQTAGIDAIETIALEDLVAHWRGVYDQVQGMAPRIGDPAQARLFREEELSRILGQLLRQADTTQGAPVYVITMPVYCQFLPDQKPNVRYNDTMDFIEMYKVKGTNPNHSPDGKWICFAAEPSAWREATELARGFGLSIMTTLKEFSDYVDSQ